MIVLGIDGGLSGGLALVALGEGGGVTYMRPTLLGVSDIPTSGEDSKRRVDVRAVMRFIRKHPPDHCFMELAQAMPEQGVSGVFRYGRAIGALEAAVQGLLIPMTLVTPQVWKKAHGLSGSDKEASRQRALQLFPSGAADLSRKMDHGRAEAALIAWHGIMQMRVTGGLRAAE